VAVTLDDRLRTDLEREATSIHGDEERALRAVWARGEAHRRHVRRVTVLSAAVAVVVSMLVVAALWSGMMNKLDGAPPPASDSPAVRHTPRPPDLPAGGNSPLDGEWRSDATALSRLPPGVRADSLRGAHRVVVQLTILDSRLGITAWDPAHPTSSLLRRDYYDRPLAHHQLLVTPTQPITRWRFAYRVTGRWLHFRFIGVSGRPSPAETAMFQALDSLPLARVR
jgi:hypothetical protein